MEPGIIKRVPIIAGNWKMNTTVDQAIALVKLMLGRLEQVTGTDKVICPPFVSLATVRQMLDGTSVKLGAQNAFWEDKGAYTGEISPLMLAPLCEFVIIGHSERRQYFGETDETVNKRLKAALKHELRPIFCVGENLAEREAGRTEDVITGQVRRGLEGIESLMGFVVAYEPVWAIGTGRAATGTMANEVIRLIRWTLAELCGREAQMIRIQYGGSVTAANIAEFIVQPEIDGALVGGASLRDDEFVKIVETTDRIKGRKS